MRLPAAALRLDRLLGHELGPREQRLLRLQSLVVVVPVPVHRGRRMVVAVGPVARHQLDRRPDGVGVVSVAPVSSTGQAVDRDGLRLHFHQLPAVVHQQLLGCGLGVPCLGEDRLQCLRLVLLTAVCPCGSSESTYKEIHRTAIEASCWNPGPSRNSTSKSREKQVTRERMAEGCVEEQQRHLYQGSDWLCISQGKRPLK